MSVFVRNNYLKGRTVTASFGTVEFNPEGIAEVSDEVADILFSLKGYEHLEGEDFDSKTDETQGLENTQESEENAQETASDNATDDNSADDKASEDESEDAEGESESEGEASEDKVLDESLLKMNVPQLKKYAKDHGIDIMGATKKDEILTIIASASE